MLLERGVIVIKSNWESQPRCAEVVQEFQEEEWRKTDKRIDVLHGRKKSEKTKEMENGVKKAFLGYWGLNIQAKWNFKNC